MAQAISEAQTDRRRTKTDKQTEKDRQSKRQIVRKRTDRQAK